jgi:hypothetical protein
VMHSLGTSQNATGCNAATAAFTLHGSDGTASAASSTEVSGSLRTRAPGGIENSSTTAVLQERPVAWSGELTASTDVAGTLQRGGEGGRLDGVMMPQMAVRRLTPHECERLQGFARRLHPGRVSRETGLRWSPLYQRNQAEGLHRQGCRELRNQAAEDLYGSLALHQVRLQGQADPAVGQPHRVAPHRRLRQARRVREGPEEG